MSRSRKPGRDPAPVAAEDVELFRQAIGPVRSLNDDERVDAAGPKPQARPLQHLRDEAQVLEELARIPLDAVAMASGEVLSYLRDGHDPRLLKRLRSGAIAVQDEVDLHALRLPAARRLLLDFLAEAVRRDIPCVRVIHGKGLRSAAGPVLKALVDRTLRQHGAVLAFCSARERDGGTGATVVLLKISPRSRPA